MGNELDQLRGKWDMSKNIIIPTNPLMEEARKAEEEKKAEELAQKLHVSKRQLYNLVDEFRAMGASIKYSRESKTYYYTNDFDLKSKILKL